MLRRPAAPIRSARRAHAAAVAALAGQRLLRVAHRAQATTSSSTPGRHGFLNGGHAHADALSIVAHRRGRAAADRSRAPAPTRWTRHCGIGSVPRAMHNTVVVDGRPQARAARSVPLAPTRQTPAPRSGNPRRGSTMREGATTATGRSCTRGASSRFTAFGWLIVDHLFCGSGDARRGARPSGTFIPSWQRVAGRGARRDPCACRWNAELAGSRQLLHVPRLERREGDGLDLFPPVYGRIATRDLRVHAPDSVRCPRALADASYP